MRTHQAQFVFELMLDVIEQVTEEVVDIVNHVELLVEAKNMRAFPSLSEFANYKSTCGWHV